MQVITNLVKLPLDRINLDRGTQCRDLSDPGTAMRHQRIRDGFVATMTGDEWDWDRSPPVVFGPIEIDGRSWYVPGDGHTRINAAKIAGMTSILCELRPGNLRDAVLYSIGPANKYYLSCALTLADLHKRIDIALSDRELWCWIDSRISKYCDDGSKKIGHYLVRKKRTEYLEKIKHQDAPEYEWRVRQLSLLKALDKRGNEIITGRSKSNGKHLKNDGTLSINVIRDLPHAAYTIARTRAAEQNLSIEEWIGATILAIDDAIAERDRVKLELIRLQNLLKSYQPLDIAIGEDDRPPSQPSSLPRYTYMGAAAEYDILGDDIVVATVVTCGTIFELKNVTDVSIPEHMLAVRPLKGQWQPHHYALLPIDKLEWLPE